eukprot:TRINITY_DN4740_c0_g1_i2.p1 TRINITY_DN4740_c0_g1~~TRINITY_DN4740_c0_g1_i2.p1  ORF type:complete len:202 (-),score=75.34 TRINITY_DN4740_c0_g1_i2:269-874(-)
MGNDGSKYLSGTNREVEQKLERWKSTWGVQDTQYKNFINVMKNLKMRDGKISKKNFKKTFVQVGFEPISAEHLFNAMDKDGSGIIDEDELLEFYGITYGGTISEQLRISFQLFDHNRNGTLDKQEVRRGFREMISLGTRMMNHVSGETTVYYSDEQVKNLEEKVDAIFAKADKNGDGLLTLAEYIVAYEEAPELCALLKQF